MHAACGVIGRKILTLTLMKQYLLKFLSLRRKERWSCAYIVMRKMLSFPKEILLILMMF
tara:strand:- start:904 stop:1080 length:177 start_codon:yes stop_codon:yes gene_type:complete